MTDTPHSRIARDVHDARLAESVTFEEFWRDCINRMILSCGAPDINPMPFMHITPAWLRGLGDRWCVLVDRVRYGNWQR